MNIKTRFNWLVGMVLLCGLGGEAKAAVLGINRAGYGVWDRTGWYSVIDYPFTRGQEFGDGWEWVNPARHTFDWTALDAQLQFAYEQNQMFFCKVTPVGIQGEPPAWIYSAGVPSTTDGTHTYGYYLDPEYQLYFAEMVNAFANHLRHELPAHLREQICFVRVDTGTSGDEEPYEEPTLIPAQYQISAQEWLDFRLWAFNLFDQAFQEGPGPVIPLMYCDIDPGEKPTEWGWVTNNVTGGFGTKYGGVVRGHHLTYSERPATAYKQYAEDSDFGIFSRNEMDGTWNYPFFQANLKLAMYWCAVEQLHAGLSIWDITGACLENTYIDDFGFAFDFFNKWAAELVPATARGGFCIFHEGLDSSDEAKFPVATYGNASRGNTARYTAICNAYASQGAQMDDLTAAAAQQLYQRLNQIGYNDSGWEIVRGNYDRFITQINPDNTSKSVFRVRGTLNASSSPYDRFARRFDSASGKNTMYFDVNDSLTPNPGQSIELSVIYLDSGTGQFALQYDAAGNSQKTAVTVTKANSNTWKTNTVVVTDWVFGNNGPNGADLMLTSVDGNDDTFHSIELVKLVDVTLNTVGQGTVTARNDGTVYDPVTGTYATGLRLEMLSVIPASGWEFSGWSGDLSGTNSRAILFPTNVDTQVTATFVNTGNLTSEDDFNTGTLTGGSGWSGGWTAVNAVNNAGVADLRFTGSLTRTLAVPIPDATFSFDWDLDKIPTSEFGMAEVYDGAWHTVWSNNMKGPDSGRDVNLLTANISLSAYGSISQVRFRMLNAIDPAHVFYVDNVSISGVGGAPVNNAPAFNSNPVVKANATEDAAYSDTIAGSATDEDAGDTLTYSKVSGPVWLNVSSNGALSGTPGSGDVGANVFTVKVEDAALASDTATLNITVLEANQEPLFAADPINKPDAVEDSVYSDTIVGSATDGDEGDILTYSTISGPVWLSVATNGVLSGTPGNSDVGPNSWIVQVSDGNGGTDTTTLSITVINVNDAPVFWVAQPIPNFPATQDEPYSGSLVGSATDEDIGDVLTYSKVSGPAWLIVATNGVLSGTPANSDVGTNQWTVMVSDGNGATDTAVLEVIVANVNDAPVFTTAPINKTNADENVAYSDTIAGSATDEDAGDTLTYSKVSGPVWLNVSSNGALSGTPGSGDVGANVFTVKVEDAALASDTAALHISVLSTYSVWSNLYSLSQGLTGDDDGDGLKNLAEFGLGGNPTNDADLGYAPTYGLASGGGSNWLEYIHVRQTDPNSGLLYYLELCDNLVSNVWSTNGYTVAGSGPFTNGFDAVTNRIDTDGKDQQFIRLIIEEY